MPSQYIGLIVGAQTRRVYAVVNPEFDIELDNPRHLLLQNEQKEGVTMIKAERGAYEAALSLADIDTIVNTWYATDAMSRPPYDGPEILKDPI